MTYLLDTCVVSELTKPRPEKKVLQWFTRCDEDLLHISCLSLGEISFGLDMIPDGRKKNDLLDWYNDFIESFHDSVLPVTESISLRWGKERARHRKKGIQIPVIDGLIACTAIEYNCILVTRNTCDYEMLNVQLLNPWL